MAPGDIAMFVLIEDASELLSAVERVTSSNSNAPLALKGVEQCLQVFLQTVNEADPSVQRSPHVIDQTHVLLQRALKRMEKMHGSWDDFSSWQAVQEVEQLKSTKKQLKAFSRSLNLTCFGSPRSIASSSTPSHPSLGGSPVQPRNSHFSPVPPGHISNMQGNHASAASATSSATQPPFQPPSNVSGGPPSGWIHSGVNSCNSGVGDLPERSASAAIRKRERSSSSQVLESEASRSSMSAPLHSASKHAARDARHAQHAQQDQRKPLAVKQTFTQPTHAELTQQAQRSTQQNTQHEKRIPTAVRDFLKPPASTGSMLSMSDRSEIQSKDQFEDPRSHHIAKAAIAEIGARMAAQEQGWPQIMNEEHSPRWAQREQDDVTAAPLCVLPSTYHAMTPPTSVSTVMAPHLPESSPDLPHHGYSAAGVYGDPGAHVHGAHAHAARLPVAGFMGGLNGPAPQPPSPHYTPPKPPSIAAAQRYAAPRPPPPPHPPTTVGSVTSEGDQSVATCSTALAGAGTSAIVFTFVDSQRDPSEPQSHALSASAHFPDPPAYTYKANSREASGSSPGIILPQLPHAAYKQYCGDSDTSSIAAGPWPAAPATAPAGSGAQAAAAAALAAARAGCAGGDSDANSVAGSAADAAAAAAAAAGRGQRGALRGAPQRASSLRSMPSLPSSVSSMWGQSAPRMCSSPRGAEEKYLFASKSTRARNHQDHLRSNSHRRSLPGPITPKTYAGPLTNCVAKIPASRYNAHHTMGCLADSPVTEMVNSIGGTKVKVVPPVSYSAQSARGSLTHTPRRFSEGCNNASARAADRAAQDVRLHAAHALSASDAVRGGPVEQRTSVNVSASWSTGALRRPCDVDSMKAEGDSGTRVIEEMEYRGGVIDEEVQLDSGSALSVYSSLAPGSAPARSGPLPAAAGAAAHAAAADSATQRRCSTASMRPPAAPPLAAAAGSAAPAVLAGAAGSSTAASAAQQRLSSAGTASYSLPLGDLKSPSDQLKCARLSYALPDGTMPSLPSARHHSQPASGVDAPDTYRSAAADAECAEPSSDVVFFPQSATSYHPSSHGGMGFETRTSCIGVTTATSYHPSRHEAPSSRAEPNSLEHANAQMHSTMNTAETDALAACTEADHMLRSPPCAADALTVNSRTPTDSPETHASSNVHAADSQNDQELNIHRSFSPRRSFMYSPVHALPSSSPRARVSMPGKMAEHSKLAPAKTRPTPKPQQVSPASDMKDTTEEKKNNKKNNSRLNNNDEENGALRRKEYDVKRKSPNGPRFKLVAEPDLAPGSSEKVLQPRTSPESLPTMPSMQASTVSSGSKVAAYRYQPLPKSSQKKLPTPKQVTIAEDLSGKLAAAVSGDSESDTPSSVGSMSNDHQKLRSQDLGTSCMIIAQPSEKRVRAESEKNGSERQLRCMVFSFFCGTCMRPPVVTEN